MKKLVGELLGTFFFVLCIGLAIQFGGDWAGLAIAAALTVLVYAGGHISGGHFNPAVSLGLAVSGKFSRNDLIPYWISQLIGAGLAGFLVTWVVGAPLAEMSLTVGVFKLIVVELLFTFLLVRVIHNVAASKCSEGKSYYGLAIGMTVFVGAVCVGSITGGAFNPAVVVGGIVAGAFSGVSVLYLFIGQLLGGVLAGFAFKKLDCE